MRAHLGRLAFACVLLCFAWFPFQDTVLSLLQRIRPGAYLKVLVLLKEAMLMCALLLLALQRVRQDCFSTASIADVCAYGYLIVVAFHALAVHAPGVSVLTAFSALRAAVLPVLLYFAGRWLPRARSDHVTVLRLCRAVGIVAVVFGIFEMALPTDIFWNGLLDLYGYLRQVKGFQADLAGGFVYGVPGNFWAFVGLRRMAGPFASPLALGYYLAVPAAFALARVDGGRTPALVSLVLLAGIALTETRAAILAILVYAGICYGRPFLVDLLHLRLTRTAVFLMLALCAGCAAASTAPRVRQFVESSVSVAEGRSVGHFEALGRSLKGVRSTPVLGKGFGTAGGWASLQGSSEKGASESAFFTLMYQTGGLGLLMFASWWVAVVSGLRRRRRATGRQEYGVLAVLNISFMLTAVISEQVTTFTSVAHFWFLNGLLLSGTMRSLGPAEEQRRAPAGGGHLPLQQAPST